MAIIDFSDKFKLCIDVVDKRTHCGGYKSSANSLQVDCWPVFMSQALDKRMSLNPVLHVKTLELSKCMY